MRWLFAALLFFAAPLGAQEPPSEFQQACVLYVVNAEPWDVEVGAKIVETGESALLGTVPPDAHLDVVLPCDFAVEIMAIAPRGEAFRSSGNDTVLFRVEFPMQQNGQRIPHNILLLR